MARKPKSKKFQKVPLRERWHKAFLAALSSGLSITSAAEKAKKTRQHVNRLRRTDPAFAEQVNAALAESCDRLEDEARRRAVEGVRRLKFHKGEPILVDGEPYVEHEYSDGLLIRLLEAHRPRQFHSRTEVRHKGRVKHEIELTDEQRDAILRDAGYIRGAGEGDSEAAGA